jgi:hypothetical protein
VTDPYGRILGCLDGIIIIIIIITITSEGGKNISKEENAEINIKASG